MRSARKAITKQADNKITVRAKAIKNRTGVARTLRANQTKGSRQYAEMTLRRQATFIDVVSKVTAINPDLLRNRIKFSGKVGEHFEIDLGMGTDVVRWSCLLFFQFIDMIHDNGSHAATLSSWENFCTVVENARFYPVALVRQARAFVLDQIRELFEGTVDSKKCRANYMTCVVTNTKQDIHTMLLFNTLRIMILNSHFKSSKKQPIKLYSKPDERGVLLNVLRLLGNTQLLELRKQNVQTRVRASSAYDKDHNQHNALLSLDMTNGSRLKDFTAMYFKYIHAVNFGDKGKFFLPERDIELIIKQVIRKDDDILDKSLFDNTANIKTVNNNKNNTRNNRRYDANYVHYNDNPLRMSVGDLKVYVFNETDLSGNLNNLKKVHQLLEPRLLYANDKNKIYFKDEFRAAKSDDIDKVSATETYANLLSKHMGDFLNGVNSLHNNVIFASGDSLACVGYIISFLLMNARNGAVQSRLMWEDSLNEQVFYVSSPNTYDVRHFFKLRAKPQTANFSANTLPDTVAQPVRTMLSRDAFLKDKLERDLQAFMNSLATQKPLIPDRNLRLSPPATRNTNSPLNRRRHVGLINGIELGTPLLKNFNNI
jgi:hypothetical protein